ncbi:MAG: DUF937 domain-containing protein [Bacteroidetes bacterium]|nr:DUF937 domain-containing protein [Bacteroidota bacterium]
MSSILDILMSSLGGGAVDQISKKLGLNSATTSKIIQVAIPLLISALAKNSSTTSGATSLQNALAKDHDGSILDDVLGFLGQPEQGDGAGILRHVLGNKQGSIQQTLGQTTGVDPNQAGQILEMLAPVVMGALGKQTSTAGLDAGGLADLLKGEAKQVRKNEPDLMGSVLGMLDQDKDGNIMNEVGGFLGKLFKSR